MTKIMLTAVLGAALVAAPAAVEAKKPDNPGAQGNQGSKRCKSIKRGFVVKGTNASFAVTQNPDGTYDGSVTLTATKANRHAEKSGVNADDQTPETFQLDDTKIKGDPAAVQPDDTVKLIGKVPYAKKGSRKRPCDDQGFGEDRYGDPAIRKASIKK